MPVSSLCSVLNWKGKSTFVNPLPSFSAGVRGPGKQYGLKELDGSSAASFLGGRCWLSLLCLIQAPLWLLFCAVQEEAGEAALRGDMVRMIMSLLSQT